MLFTGLMFGLSPSPFELEGTIKYHLERYEQDQPQTIIELKQNMYVDDVIGGGDNVELQSIQEEHRQNIQWSWLQVTQMEL